MDTIKDMELWVEERHEDFYATKVKVNDVLYSKKSNFQHIQVVETKGFGKMLLNDGIIMVTERDECIYHEMITHVPMFVHPNPKNVLVIGGGDGGTVKQILKHKSVESCVLVEIDPLVLEACREFLKTTSSKLDDPKVEVLTLDGSKYVKETNRTFDIIMIDSTDPFGPSVPLFGKEFYKNIHNTLSKDGIVISQFESPFYNSKFQKKMYDLLDSIFKVVRIYNYHNMVYTSGLWSFSFASKNLHPVKDFKLEHVKKSGIKFKYYNSGIHTSAFKLPSFMLDNLKGVECQPIIR